MPEIIRSFLVVMVIATMVFGAAQANAKVLGLDVSILKIRRNAWFVITSAAFLSHDFWIFSGIAVVTLLYANAHEKNTLSLVFFVLLAVPLFGSDISGFGIINYFFELNYFRIVSITLLLPLYLKLKKDRNVVPFGRYWSDKLLYGYILYTLILVFPSTSITNFLRIIFGYIVDIFLPYYIASRYLRSANDFSDAMKAFVIGALVVGLIGFFEFLKGWLLYSTLHKALGAENWGYGGYLLRGSDLRALSSTGQPIVLGYIAAVALGIFLWVKDSIQSKAVRWVVFFALLACLLAPLSRGPWIGAVVMVLAYFSFQTGSVAKISRTLMIAVIIGSSIMATPMGDQILEILPGSENVDKRNINFRQDLLSNALVVISRNPFFGSSDYLASEEMGAMRNGGDRGIIDVVNSYLAIALSGGLVGLFLFSGIFLSCGFVLWKFIQRKDVVFFDKNLAVALLSVLLGIMVIIYTVSSITFIPIIYWFVCGMCVSAVQLFDKKQTG